MRRSVSMPYILRIVALLLSAALFFNSAGHTLAYIVTKTPSLINTFLSGLEPAGDLTIRKNLEHPFGDGYRVPGNLVFDFAITLEGYGGRTVRTSQGDLIADENGTISLQLKPGEALRILNIREGTKVTVTEKEVPGFIPTEGQEQTITIREGKNELVYTNVYSPAPVPQTNIEVNGRKILEGRKWQEGDRFTFRLEYKAMGSDDWDELGTAEVAYVLEEVPDPEDPEKTIWQPKADFDRFYFTDLVQSVTYDRAGIYSFRISEVEGTVPGVTYDKVVSYFDVEVSDRDMDGALEILEVRGYQHATATYDDKTNTHRIDVTVQNIYAPAGNATVTLQIRKTVESRSGEDHVPAGFTFSLYTLEEELVATSEQTSAAGETDIELTFGPQDAGKTYHYILRENLAGKTIQGMTFDDTEYFISVSIVDNLDGTISAYIYSTDDYSEAVIEEETDGTEPDEENTEPTDPTEESTEPTDPTEESTEPSDPTEDSTEPSDPTEETTAPTEAPTEPGTEATIPETTEPTEDTSAPTEESAIPVETTEEEAGTIPQETGSNAEEIDAQEQTVSAKFSTVETAQAENHSVFLENSGTVFSCEDGLLSETSPGAEEILVISDTEPVQEVTEPTERTEPLPAVETPSDKDEEEDATVRVTVIPEDATDQYTVSFRNVYDPEDTAAHFGGSKKLSGRALQTGEFIFDLYETGENFAVTEDMKPIQSVSHDKSGGFFFAPLEYKKVGIYRYAVLENQGKTLGGVSYDPRVFHVTVTVTDDGGVLKARVVTTDELGCEADIIFRNSYKAEKTSAVFAGNKILTGAQLKADRFVFRLYAADEDFNIQGGVLDTATNQGDGSFAFAEISYTEPGIFYYVIDEDSTAKEPGITYDTNRYGVSVVVADDGQGLLTATVNYWLGDEKVDLLTFRNRYSEPDPSDETTEPETTEETTAPTETETEPSQTTKPVETTKPKNPHIPQTGDDSQIQRHVSVMFVSLAAIILLLPGVIRQRRMRRKGK